MTTPIDPGGPIDPGVPAADQALPPDGDRLDPFALPPATGGRFLLLVLASLATGAHLYLWLVERVEAISPDPARCGRTASRIAETVSAGQLMDWYSSCIQQANLRVGTIVCVMLVVLVTGTLAGYLLLPGWLARTHLTAESVAADPDTRAAALPLVDLLRRERPRRGRIDLLFCASPGVPGGRAFGRLGRYRVVISLGELTQGRAGSILAHELAHIRNHDVDLTYLAVSVWWAALASTLVPLGAVAVTAPSQLPSLAWRLGILMTLLWLVRASVLRTRELYADARAAQTRGGEDLVSAIEQRAHAAPAHPHRIRARWSAWFDPHPTRQARIRAIRSGSGLFRLDPVVAAAVGCMIGLGMAPGSYLLALFWPDGGEGRAWLTGLLFGAPAASVLSGSIWRAVSYTRMTGQRLPSTLPTVGAFTTGLLAAQTLTPTLPVVGSWPSLLVRAPLVAAAVTVLLLASVQVYVRWTVLCADTWLRGDDRPRRAAYRLGVAQSAVVVGLWLGFWGFVLGILATAPSLRLLAVPLFSVALNPVLLLSVAWACAYPAVARRGRLVAVANRGAVGLLVGYAAAVIPLHPRLVEAAHQMLPPNTAQPRDILNLVAVILAPAGILLPVVAALTGFAAAGPRQGSPDPGDSTPGDSTPNHSAPGPGDRGALARAAVSGGVLGLLSGAGILVVAVVHLVVAVAGLSMVPTGLVLFATGKGTGAILLLLSAGSLVIAVPCALLGGAGRLIWWTARRPGSPRPLRPVRPQPLRPVRPQPLRPVRPRPWLAGLRAVPLVGVVGVVAWFGLGAWIPVKTGAVGPLIGQDQLPRLLVDPTPGTVTRAEACRTLAGVERSASVPAATGSTYLVAIARAVVAAQSSDDPGLRALGTASADALWLTRTSRATHGLVLMGHYCASAPA